MNDILGRNISHAQGLRQGDPISSLLFFITMDTLTNLILQVVDEEVMENLPGIVPIQRMPIFVDDVVFFLGPSCRDLNGLC